MLVLDEVCEGFGLAPTRALWELENDPEQWALRILRCRRYKELVRAAAKVDDYNKLPDTPLTKIVLDHRFDGMRETFERKKQEAAERARRRIQGHG